MGRLVWGGALAGVVLLAILVFAPQWTSFPPSATENGPPGLSMIAFHSGQMPEPVPQAPPEIQPVSAEAQASLAGGYKNVQVLRDLAPADFLRLQQAITQWVSPTEGCGFCHVSGNYAADDKPQKVAARLMLRMTRHINADMQNHVAPAGVTCFTCHRGQPVPAETWFPLPPRAQSSWASRQENWNEAADTVRKFFTDDSWQEYLLGDEPIQAEPRTALPTGTAKAEVVVARIYEMMMQMSDGMGVNCTYCHNSRAFSDWSQSTPERWIGFYALHQTRELNSDYLLDLAAHIPMTRQRQHETRLPVIPAQQEGTMPGNGFVVCATCHYAQPKPMGGRPVIQEWPGLVGPQQQAENR